MSFLWFVGGDLSHGAINLLGWAPLCALCRTCDAWQRGWASQSEQVFQSSFMLRATSGRDLLSERVPWCLCSQGKMNWVLVQPPQRQSKRFLYLACAGIKVNEDSTFNLSFSCSKVTSTICPETLFSQFALRSLSSCRARSSSWMPSQQSPPCFYFLPKSHHFLRAPCFPFFF